MAIVSFFLLWVTYDYTCSTKEQVGLTRDSLEVTREFLEVTRESFEVSKEAFLLDQRPWVGYYGYAIEARENPNAAWVEREPAAGEEFRVSFSIKNVGQTPALNLQLASIISISDAGYTPSPPDEWDLGSMKNTVFPKSEGFRQYSGKARLGSEDFSEYLTHKKRLYFQAMLYYCDGVGRRHWTEVVVSHGFASGSYSILASRIGSDSGEASHPDCED